MNGRQRNTLRAAITRLLPLDGDHAPRADDVGAASYVEQLLGNRHQPASQLVTGGLDWLDAAAHERFRCSFSEAHRSDQDNLLSESLANHDLRAFVPTLLSAAIEGVLCHPSRGGNADGRGWQALGCNWE